ncbi:MAG: hypothetical protein NXY57DRAFT_1005989 [Lentinula lateritia]|nr:MAG: hypothetical protein NXY57DRAFT_1005989 [Lentinula lateritia]
MYTCPDCLQSFNGPQKSLTTIRIARKKASQPNISRHCRHYQERQSVFLQTNYNDNSSVRRVRDCSCPPGHTDNVPGSAYYDYGTFSICAFVLSLWRFKMFIMFPCVCSTSQTMTSLLPAQWTLILYVCCIYVSMNINKLHAKDNART